MCRTLDQADQKKNWAQCLADDIRAFQATEGSSESYPFFAVCSEQRLCYGRGRLRKRKVGSGVGGSSKHSDEVYGEVAQGRGREELTTKVGWGGSRTYTDESMKK